MGIEGDRPSITLVRVEREESRPSITLAGVSKCIKWDSDNHCKEFSKLSLL